MQLQTHIDIKPFEQKINHSQPILSIGSCFADNIAKRLQHSKFQTVASPTGILFNPESIAATLDRFDAVARGDNGALPAAEDLAYGNERWFSYDFHSDFSATDATDALAAMKNTPCMNFSVHAFDFILFYDLIPSISFPNINCIYLINCHIFCWVI